MGEVSGSGSSMGPIENYDIVGPGQTSSTDQVTTGGEVPDTVQQAEDAEKAIVGLIISGLPLLIPPGMTTGQINDNVLDGIKDLAKITERNHELVTGLLDAWLETIADEAEGGREASRVAAMAAEMLIYAATLQALDKALVETGEVNELTVASVVNTLAATMAAMTLGILSTFRESLAESRAQGIEAENRSMPAEEAREKGDLYAATVTFLVALQAMTVVLRAEAELNRVLGREEGEGPERPEDDPTRTIQDLMEHEKGVLKASGMTDEELARYEENMAAEIDAAYEEGGELHAINTILAVLLMVLEAQQPQTGTNTAA